MPAVGLIDPPGEERHRDWRAVHAFSLFQWYFSFFVPDSDEQHE